MKSVLLGSAFAVVAATGAQAADPILDVKAPREPVYRCDVTGFIEMPGTDVCFKVGGFARFVAKGGDNWPDGLFPAAWDIGPDTAILDTDAAGFPTLLADLDGNDDDFEMFGYGRVNFDARTVTEYGTVRAFIEMDAWNGRGSENLDFRLRHAFVQFGNWTFGQTWSNFGDGDALGNVSAAFTTVGDNTFRAPQVRYTQSFGGGVSLTVAIEDGEVSEQDALFSIYSPTGLVPGGFPFADELGDTSGAWVADLEQDNTHWPAFVAAVQVEGDWGHARLSGVITQNDFDRITVTGAGTAADPEIISRTDADEEIGWGINFGLGINAPMLGEGDNFVLNANYTDGASGYSGAGAGFSAAYGDCSGGLGTSFCITDTAEAWSVGVAFQHFWTPTVNSTIGGGYGSVDYGSNTQFVGFDNVTDSYILGDGGYDVWDVYANVEWTPVRNTAFLVEARYGQVDGNWEYTYDTPGVDYTIDGDRDAWSVAFQATRSF